MSTYPAMVEYELSRNNLRGLAFAFSPGLAMGRPATPSLIKIVKDTAPTEETLRYRRLTRNIPTPQYPLVGHRRGLRANDLTVLASAFYLATTC